MLKTRLDSTFLWTLLFWFALIALFRNTIVGRVIDSAFGLYENKKYSFPISIPLSLLTRVSHSLSLYHSISLSLLHSFFSPPQNLLINGKPITYFSLLISFFHLTVHSFSLLLPQSISPSNSRWRRDRYFRL